eukprot:Awhi_evm1s12393
MPVFDVKSNACTSVWAWLWDKEGKGSPWSYKCDIVIPNNFEMGLWSRIESGCCIDENAK